MRPALWYVRFMRRHITRSILQALLIAWCAVIFGPGATQAQRYEFPELDGYRLDICLRYGRDCGKPAANAFCEDKGFGPAADFAIATDIGLLTPTITFATRKVCTSAGCDGFRYIHCGPVPAEKPRERRFDRPLYDGYRLDYCLFWEEDCGKSAADAFCRSQGYSHAGSFDLDENIGEDGKQTRVMADGQVCDKPECDGFTFIQCVP